MKKGEVGVRDISRRNQVRVENSIITFESNDLIETCKSDSRLSNHFFITKENDRRVDGRLATNGSGLVLTFYKAMPDFCGCILTSKINTCIVRTQLYFCVDLNIKCFPKLQLLCSALYRCNKALGLISCARSALGNERRLNNTLQIMIKIERAHNSRARLLFNRTRHTLQRCTHQHTASDRKN